LKRSDWGSGFQRLETTGSFFSSGLDQKLFFSVRSVEVLEEDVVVVVVVSFPLKCGGIYLFPSDFGIGLSNRILTGSTCDDEFGDCCRTANTRQSDFGDESWRIGD
jgi:hypothetical protein